MDQVNSTFDQVIFAFTYIYFPPEPNCEDPTGLTEIMNNPLP